MGNEVTGINATIEIAGESYRLLHVRISELLSEVPTLDCEIVKDGPLPDPSTLLDAKLEVTLTRVGETANPKHFRGVVVGATRRADKAGRPSITLTGAPALWKLSKRQDLRIFQDKSVVDVVKEVLEGGGVKDVDVRLSGSYSPRVYVTQYRESDLEFVLRLLSEEGIYFLHDFKEKDLLILCDDTKGAGDAADKELTYDPGLGFDVSALSVKSVHQTRRVRTDKTFTREYDFERPKLKLEGKAESKDPGSHALEVYAYPGRFLEEAVGKRYAQVLLDSIQADRDVVDGSATTLTLSAGLRFTVAQHPYSPLNREYLLTSVVTEYRERGSSVDFAPSGFFCNVHWTAIPTDQSPFRPVRRPRPVTVAGIQTALTTGAPGQEIHTDKHGRVKVKFPWDRISAADDKSSVWMRTSQVPTGGSMLLPRVGWEVIVQANEGDADHPLVMGRVYNAQKPPPYALPAHKARASIQTATTPGGGTSNEIRTDDSKGGEEMFFNASRDMTIDVLNNTTETVANNATHEVGVNHTLEVTNSVSLVVGADQTHDIKGKQTVHVSTFMVDDTTGNHTLKISGNRDMKVGGDHKRTVTSDSKVKVGSVASDLVVGKVSEKVTGDYKLDVSAVRATLTVANHDTKITGNHTEKDGVAKVIVTFGGKSVDVTGSLELMVGGAVLAKVDGDRSESTEAKFTEVAAGANIIKAKNVSFEAEDLLTFVMGASILLMTPQSVSLVGTSIKVDGVVTETSIMTVDN